MRSLVFVALLLALAACGPRIVPPEGMTPEAARAIEYQCKIETRSFGCGTNGVCGPLPDRKLYRECLSVHGFVKVSD